MEGEQDMMKGRFVAVEVDVELIGACCMEVGYAVHQDILYAREIKRGGLVEVVAAEMELNIKIGEDIAQIG